jgi:GT2 family glycosyltransferase
MRSLVFGALAYASLVPFVRGWQRGRAARSLRRWQNHGEPASWPSVSIIVPAWNERGTVEGCLERLERLDYSAPYEIIVMAGGDDGTLDAVREIARSHPRIRAFPQRPDGGKNGALNDGARLASADVLVFVDADALTDSEWLKELVTALDEQFAASNGKYLSMRRTPVSRAGEMTQLLEAEVRGRVILQGSGGIAVRRSAWAAIGGLPEWLFADDWGLTVLLERAGLQVAYAPDALLLTERPASVREWWRNELRWRRIHLVSLFGAADSELATPFSAARALYPYVSAWAGLMLSAAALASFVNGRHEHRTLRATALLGLAPLVAREAAGAVETAAFTGDSIWLRTAPAVSLLTVLGWSATVLATITTGKANIHFKGPRTASSHTRSRRDLLADAPAAAAGALAPDLPAPRAESVSTP